MSAPKHQHQEEPEKEENLERWLLTYADLITLLMLFFIVLYAMSSITKPKFEQLAESLTFGFTTGYALIRIAEKESEVLKHANYEDTHKSKTKRKIYLSHTYKRALFIFQQEIKDNKIRVDMNERGILISLSSDTYFKSNSAELDIERSRYVLEKIANFLDQIKNDVNRVMVEGHTDSVPPDPEGPWASNWALASARANNVLYYLVDFGTPPELLSSASFGEFRPIFPNDTEENRAKNRRVDIAITRED